MSKCISPNCISHICFNSRDHQQDGTPIQERREGEEEVGRRRTPPRRPRLPGKKHIDVQGRYPGVLQGDKSLMMLMPMMVISDALGRKVFADGQILDKQREWLHFLFTLQLNAKTRCTPIIIPWHICKLMQNMHQWSSTEQNASDTRTGTCPSIPSCWKPFMGWSWWRTRTRNIYLLTDREALQENDTEEWLQNLFLHQFTLKLH